MKSQPAAAPAAGHNLHSRALTRPPHAFRSGTPDISERPAS